MDCGVIEAKQIAYTFLQVCLCLYMRCVVPFLNALRYDRLASDLPGRQVFASSAFVCSYRTGVEKCAGVWFLRIVVAIYHN